MNDQLSCLVPVMDGVEQNKLYPDTFEIPSNMDKANIRPGDFVKAGFATDVDTPTERMWVLVTEIAAGVIRGRLASEPVITKAKLDDPVAMEFRHVIEIKEAA